MIDETTAAACRAELLAAFASGKRKLVPGSREFGIPPSCAGGVGDTGSKYTVSKRQGLELEDMLLALGYRGERHGRKLAINCQTNSCVGVTISYEGNDCVMWMWAMPEGSGAW